jgi:diacylglycerol kinase (ATP)
MRVAVVFKPDKASSEVDELESSLADREADVSWLETTEEESGMAQAQAALEDGAEVVIVCGGDGTVRECAQGLVGSEVPIAIMPAGTGNLLARNLELPDIADEVVDLAMSGPRRRLDLGRVNDEVFAVMAGTGIDASIMEDTDSEAKDRLGVLAYVLEGAKHLFDDPFRATVRTGGGEASSDNFAMVLVGNLGRLQGGIEIFPDASPDDGKLELFGLISDGPGEALLGAVQAAAKTDTHRHLRTSDREFVVELEEPRAYELDGDSRPEANLLEFGVVPGGLLVCAPEVTR